MAAASRGAGARTPFLLTREGWEQVERPPVEITGLEPCLPLFGLPGDLSG